MPDFVPRAEAQLPPWLENLKDKSTAEASTFGIPPADLTELASSITAYGEATSALGDFKVQKRQATKEKNAKKRAVIEVARKLAEKIKVHKAYNDGYGQLFRIDGSNPPVDLTNAKPRLEGKSLADGGVELSYNKGDAEGVNIYGQRDGEAGFTFLGRDLRSPYVDERPCVVEGKPETRRYKAIYVLNDKQVGLFSDEIVVICQS